MQLQPIAIAFVLGAAAGAQSNPFIVFPLDPQRQAVTCASYVGRPDWTNAAEGFQELSPAWFRGVGDATAGCRVDGFYHWAADENVTTSETYGIVLRSASGGLLDPTPAGELLRISGLTTPTAVGVRGTFVMIDTFATPVAVPCDHWFQGMEFPANANWPTTDGHSLWRADVPGITQATTGENPRANAPRVTWTLTAAGQTINTGWTYLMGAMAPAPMLHLGGIDPSSGRTGPAAAPVFGAPSYGMNGLFPDISGTPRADGVNVRIQDSARPAGLALAAIGLQYFAVPLSFPGLQGEVFLDPGSLATVGFAPMVGGAAVLPVAAPGTIPPLLVGTVLLFQGAVLDPVTGAGAFTNVQAVSF
jgi:hypothetical protein